MGPYIKSTVSQAARWVRPRNRNGRDGRHRRGRPCRGAGRGHAAPRGAHRADRAGGEEPYLPYNRPPLSKKYLAGELERERLWLRSAQFYQQHRVETRLGVRVTALDRASQRLRLGDGGELTYDKLLLCVAASRGGSRCPATSSPASTAAHDRRRRCHPCGHAGARRLVVVGGGYIGSRPRPAPGSSASRPRARDGGPAHGARGRAEVSAFYLERHRREGVQVHCGTTVTAFAGQWPGRRRALRRARIPGGPRHRRRRHPARRHARGRRGLRCGNGVWVDEECRTSDPNVYAAGDCTNHPSVRYGRRVRLESVDNAVEQAKTAALNICGKQARHEHVPWFWSDQYDVKLQIAGLSEGYDQTVLRGDPASAASPCTTSPAASCSR